VPLPESIRRGIEARVEARRTDEQTKPMAGISRAQKEGMK
jgi:hypothetical protein